MEHKISLLKRAGESVFPVKMDMGDGSKIEDMGMTLRDYFAAKAMQGILSNNSMIDTATESTFEWVTKNAYQLADAMLKARGGNET